MSHAAARSFDAKCDIHGWPLLSGGHCAWCRRDAAAGVVVERCPSHTTWTKDEKALVIDGLMEAMTPGVREDERKQRFWEKALDICGRQRGFVHNYTTPPAVAYERLRARVHSQATTGD